MMEQEVVMRVSGDRGVLVGNIYMMTMDGTYCRIKIFIFIIIIIIIIIFIIIIIIIIIFIIIIIILVLFLTIFLNTKVRWIP